MELPLLIMLSALAIVFVISRLLDFVFRHHKTSNVLNALFTHFKERNEIPIEFRIVESKAKQKTREFG